MGSLVLAIIGFIFVLLGIFPLLGWLNWIGIILLIIGFLTAMILFVVPLPPLRAFYPSSVLCLLSFLFLIRYYIEEYKLNFSKLLCYIILTICLFLTPRFIIPLYSLHLQEQSRNSIEQENTDIMPLPYFVLKGPTLNLTIALMDPAKRINLYGNVYMADATKPINW